MIFDGRPPQLAASSQSSAIVLIGLIIERKSILLAKAGAITSDAASDHDGSADHVGWALFTSGAFGHIESIEEQR